MHIVGFEPRLAEIGQIKIGEKDEGKGYPKKLDHFKLCLSQRNAAGNLIRNDEIHKLLGDKPMEIPVVLLYDDIEMNLPHYYAYYAATRWICKGDGQKARQRKIDPQTKAVLEEKEVTCPCDFLTVKDEKGATRCKPCGILQVMLRGIDRTGGMFTFRTHSWNSLRDLLGSMMFIKNTACGKLAGIPLTLVLKPTQGQDATGRKTTNWTVCLVYDGDPLALREYGMKMLQLDVGHKKEMKALTAGAEVLIKSITNEEPDEERHIAEEYYSEAEDAEATITQTEAIPAPTLSTAPEAAPPPQTQQEPPPAQVVTPPTPAPVPAAATDTAEAEDLFNRLGFNAGRRQLLWNKYKTPEALIGYLSGLLAQRGGV